MIKVENQGSYVKTTKNLEREILGGKEMHAYVREMDDVACAT